MLLGCELLEYVVESIRGPVAIVLEPFDPEALDGGPETVESGFHPGLLHGDRHVGIVRADGVLHALHGRHEPDINKLTIKKKFFF